MKTNIHATCVNLKGKGVLFFGASGSGKSDLALRLIAGYQAKLVADDRVDIETADNRLRASAPEILSGLLEVRGVGIIKTDFLKDSPIDLVVRLTNSPLERLPEKNTSELCGIKIPSIELNPFEVSAPAKVLAALSLL